MRKKFATPLKVDERLSGNTGKFVDLVGKKL
jgi:hypothetical protein